MNKIKRLVVMNQASGPMFLELTQGLSELYTDGVLLVTGDRSTLSKAETFPKSLKVSRAPEYNRNSYFKRVVSWASYLAVASKHVILANEGDAFFLVSNPPILMPLVWFLTFFRRFPYGVLVYDIYPDVLVAQRLINEDGLLSKLWSFVNKCSYARARFVVTIGQRMSRRLERQIKNSLCPLTVVPLWADVDKIRPKSRENNPYAHLFINREEFVVLYSGNMGASHDIQSMLEAAQILKPHKQIVFIFIGDGANRYLVEQYIDKNPDSNVRFFPFQPESMVPFTLTLADLSLVSLDEGMEDLMVPSKIFSYMAAGSAILAIAHDNSELSDVVDQSGIGARIKPRHPELIAQEVLVFVNNPERLLECKRKARILAEKNYSLKACVDSFSTVLKESI